MDLRTSPNNIKILLESSPLKCGILVRRLAVCMSAHATLTPWRLSPLRRAGSRSCIISARLLAVVDASVVGVDSSQSVSTCMLRCGLASAPLYHVQ